MTSYNAIAMSMKTIAMESHASGPSRSRRRLEGVLAVLKLLWVRGWIHTEVLPLCKDDSLAPSFFPPNVKNLFGNSLKKGFPESSGSPLSYISFIPNTNGLARTKGNEWRTMSWTRWGSWSRRIAIQGQSGPLSESWQFRVHFFRVQY